MNMSSIGEMPRVALRHDGKVGGPLVLFLHGIGGNSLNWVEQLREIAPFAHAVAWDMRGYGLSEDYEGPYSLDAVAHDIDRIVDHFGSPRVHLVGLSMGGMVALEYYRRSPARVASMLLCNTNAGIARDYSDAQKAEFVRLRKAPLVAGRSLEEMIPNMLPVLLGAQPTAAAVAAITDSLRRLHPQSYIKAIEAIVDFDCADVLPLITVPVHLVASDEDKVTPAETMRMMVPAIPGATFDLIAGAGHLSNLEAPERFNAILVDFLERQLGRPG